MDAFSPYITNFSRENKIRTRINRDFTARSHLCPNSQLKPRHPIEGMKQQLPLELWSQIFMLAATTRGAPSTKLFMHCSAALSQVCRQWRQFALDTPDLWTTLNVGLGSNLEFARLYLKRSRDCDLRMFVNLTVKDRWAHDTRFIESRDLDALLEVVIPEIARWRTLKVRLHFNLHARIFLDAINQPALRLRSFMFQDWTGWQHPRNNGSELFGGIAPHLRELCFHADHFNWPETTPLHRLESLTWLLPADNRNALFIDSLTHILRMASSSLKSLSVAASYWERDAGDLPPTDDDRITLPNLVSLSLADLDKVYTERLLQRLHLPALTSLDFVNMASSYRTNQSLIVPLLLRQDDMLHNLQNLKIGYFSNHDMKLLFAPLRSLRSLTLFGQRTWEECASLLVGSDEQKLVPSLSSLTQLCMSSWTYKFDALQHIIQSRAEYGIPIRQLRFEQPSDLASKRDWFDWLGSHIPSIEVVPEWRQEEDEE